MGSDKSNTKLNKKQNERKFQTGYEYGDEGVNALSEALKANTALTSLFISQ